MEHGFITTVRYENGGIILDVRAFRTGVEYQGVPVLKPMAGFVAAPEEGQKVFMDTLADDTRYVVGILASNPLGSYPASVEENELAIQLDGNTLITAKKDGSGNYDLTLSASGDINIDASGDVKIDGIDFDQHEHHYTWTDGGGNADTDPPKNPD